VIERHAIGAGSSGGLVGALAPHVPENWNDKKQFQLESLLMAEGWWADVTAATGGIDPGYLRSGRLQPIPDDRALQNARARIDEARTLWQGRADWRVIPATGAAWEPHSPTAGSSTTRSPPAHPRRALPAPP
jgi:glycine oxidase